MRSFTQPSTGERLEFDAELPADLDGAFLVVESKVAEPIVRLSMFANPSVRYGNLLTAVGAASGIAATWFGTLYWNAT